MGLGPSSPISLTLLGVNSAGTFPSMAAWGARLMIAGHGVSGGSGFILSGIRHRGRGAGFHVSPKALGAGRGGQAGTALARVGHSRRQRSHSAVPTSHPCRCTQLVYLRPPCVIIFFFPSSLGLTFADKLALISQNVILQLRAKSSQVLRLNSFSKPSLH